MDFPHWFRLTDRGFELPVAIFDMDGVLSDASHRQHHLNSDPPNWDGFGATSHLDPPLVEGPGRLAALRPDHLITLVTARPAPMIDVTADWLERHEIWVDLIVLRPVDDSRPSQELKLTELQRIRRRGGDVRIAFEDDPENHRMYVEAGVESVYIHSGYYDQGKAVP